MGEAKDIFDGAVSWPIDAAAVRLRLSDRLMQRLPALTRRVAPRVLAESPGSRGRRWIFTRALAAGWGAFDRRDWAYIERMYEPDGLMLTADDVFIDLPPRADGWMEVRHYQETLLEGFRESDARPVEIIDPGGRYIAARVEASFEGAYTGLKVRRALVTLYELSDEGLVARQWVANDVDALARFLADPVQGFGAPPSSPGR